MGIFHIFQIVQVVPNCVERLIYVSWTRKAKRNYYEILYLNNIRNSKKIWATVKLLISNKIKSAESIVLNFLLSITKEKIEKLVTNLNCRKTFQSEDIPANLVENLAIYFPSISLQALTDVE